MQFDASSYFVPKGSGSADVIWQATGLHYLGVKQFRGKKGPFVEAQAMFQFWRRKPNGDLVPLCGVCDANTKPGNTFRVVLEALGVGGFDDRQKIPVHLIKRFCEDFNLKLKESRPGVRMEYTIGHGFIKVKEASPANVARDCAMSDTSSLGSAIIERHLGDARRVLLDGEEDGGGQKDGAPAGDAHEGGVREGSGTGEDGGPEPLRMGESASVQRAINDMVDVLLGEDRVT